MRAGAAVRPTASQPRPRGTPSTFERARTVRNLIVPTLRAVRWLPLIVAGMAAPVAFEIARPKVFMDPVAPDAIRASRIAMVVIVLGVPFFLDDPGADTVAATPTRLWVRRAVRIAFALPIVAAAWFLLVHYARWTLLHLPSFPPAAPLDPRVATAIPWWGLGRQFAAFVVVALALAGLAARVRPKVPASVIAGPAFLALIGATMLLPRQFTLWAVDPRFRSWNDARDRWTIAVVVGLAGLWHVSRDPARPSLTSRVRSRLRRGSGAAEAPRSARSSV